MMTDVLSHAIQEIERCQRSDLAPAIAKALAVTRTLQLVLDDPRPAGLEQALTDLAVSALVDEDGGTQLRYTCGFRRGP